MNQRNIILTHTEAMVAACFTQVWGYRNPDKVNIGLLDKSFECRLRQAEIVMPNERIEFIEVLEEQPVSIQVILTNGVELRIDPFSIEVTTR